MDRQELYRQFPFLEPGGSEVFLVIGDDLDSFLSAMLFMQYHPAARVIGFYEQYTRLFLVNDYRDRLRQTLWIDLDIYHPHCQSLGHHILRLTSRDSLPGMQHSCNVNELRGIDINSFHRKYPLGTIHFLSALYGEGYIPDSKAELLFWLADSSYINGQRHRFRENVQEWIDHFLQHDVLLSTFEKIDTMAFEERMNGLFEELGSKGFLQKTGQVTSRHLRLSGFQFQTSFHDREYFAAIARYLAEATGLPNVLDHVEVESINQRFEGTRRSGRMFTVFDGRNIDEFLQHNNVFSYVIPQRTTINYTAGIHL